MDTGCAMSSSDSLPSGGESSTFASNREPFRSSSGQNNDSSSLKRSGERQRDDGEGDMGSDEKQEKQKFTRSRTACLQVCQSPILARSYTYARVLVPISQVKMWGTTSSSISQLYRRTSGLSVAIRGQEIISSTYATSKVEDESGWV